MEHIKLGISTCPNDTFIFGAFVNNYIEHPFNLNIIMDDVQVCNNIAIDSKLDVIKVSFGVYNLIKYNYKILKSGGALGFGCGPLLLSKKHLSIEDLYNKKIGIPGKNTTAYMILKKLFPKAAKNIVEMRFNFIIPAIINGDIDGGLVIHEGRFIYQNFGLNNIVDLGVEWENIYKQPIPLGFIAVKKDKLHLADKINYTIRSSLEYAYDNTNKIMTFIKKYAQDMDDNVIKSHIDLYINKYSKDMTLASDAISILLETDESIFA